MWLDNLTSTNCKAKLQFRAGQTSLIINSYLQQNIFNQQRGRADTILLPHLRKALARCATCFKNFKLTNMTNYFLRFKKVTFILLFCVFYLTNQSIGQSQPYLDGLPTRNDIISKVSGNTPRETYGKQIAALKFMCDIIGEHKLEIEPKLELTAKETALLKEYNSWGKLIDEYSKNAEPLEGTKRREFEVYSHNLNNDELKNYVVTNLFNSEARERYMEVKKLRNEDAIEISKINSQERKEKERLNEQRSSHKTNAVISFIVGVIFLILWIRLRLWIGKRQFNRRNEHGVEEFKTHGDLVKKRLSEESVGWLSFFALVIGLGLIIYGVYLISLLN